MAKKRKLKPSRPKSNFWPEAGPIAIAHRGGDGAGGSKENTMEAFEAAGKLGYKYAETDVILAASGDLVTIHGSGNWMQASVTRDMTRSTLQKMTYEQMQLIIKPGGSNVPRLAEVLTAFPKMKFVLDLKTDETVLPLVRMLKQLGALNRVSITGFNYRRTRAFIALCKDPTVSTGLTIGRGVHVKNMNLLMLKTGRLSDVEAVFMHHSLVSTPMLNLVHKRGLRAAVWTANSSLSIKHALRSGADAVISDRVVLLKEILSSKK
jgi:glycerophosphoryl diester phosphodiesterase